MAKEESTAQAEPVKESPDTGTPGKASAPPTFSGSQLIRSVSGVDRDIMAAILLPDQQYTDADVKSAIDKFLKKEVSINGGR